MLRSETTVAGMTQADRLASYAILWTEHDNPMAWLQAGEALSAVLLGATVAGRAVSPISDSGAAMSKHRTEVARHAADLVLAGADLGRQRPTASIGTLANRLRPHRSINGPTT